MAKQPGITLIELLIGLLISSILITALFSIYNTITRTVARSTEKIDRERAVTIFQNQWQKDIEAVFAPPYPEKEAKKKPEEKEKVEKEKVDKEKVEVKEEKKEKPKPLKKIFDSVNKEENLERCTFITTNQITVYQKGHAAKQRMVRVTYRMQSDKKKPASYTLVRQESDTLTVDEAKTNKGYELLSGIKKISVEYLVAEQKDKDKDKEEKEKKKQTKGRTFKSFKEWHSDERQKEEKAVPLIPEIVRTTLVMHDAEKKGEFSYSFDYRIAAYEQKIVIQEAPKQPVQQPQQAGPQGQGSMSGTAIFVTPSPRMQSMLEQIEKKLDEKLGRRI